MRAWNLLLVLLSAWMTAGCYVVSVSGLADTASSVSDDSLLGRWKSTDDDLELLVARDEWSTYAVTLRDRTGEQRFTARLITLARTQFFDVTIHSGTETNAAVLPVHIIGRVSRHDAELHVELLDYDWFRGRLGRGSLTTSAVLDERETLLLTASRAQLRKWLTANAASPTLFAEPITLAKDESETK